jgi:hypothetical protein
VVGSRGALIEPESTRASVQARARRRLHTAIANRKQVNGLSPGRHREVRATRREGDGNRRKGALRPTRQKRIPAMGSARWLRSLVQVDGDQGALFWPE